MTTPLLLPTPISDPTSRFHAAPLLHSPQKDRSPMMKKTNPELTPSQPTLSAAASTAQPSTEAAMPLPITAPTSVAGVAKGHYGCPKADRTAACVALITALTVDYTPDDRFHLLGEPQTRDEVIAILQQYLTATDETEVSYQHWRAAVRRERAVAERTELLRTSLKGVISGRLGHENPELRRFGFEPRKVPARRGATKASPAAHVASPLPPPEEK